MRIRASRVVAPHDCHHDYDTAHFDWRKCDLRKCRSNRSVHGNGIFTDGTSKDVTADGQWQSSDTGVATISETGEARIVGFGTCIISFEYEKQLASVNLRSGSPATITLSGRVREPGSGGLVGVRVVETSSGRSAVTTGFGQFAITDVPRGQSRLKVEKDGYETRELDTTEQEGIDLPIQRVVRLNAGETVKPADLAPNDVPYTIRNDECICRLIRVSVSRAGTLGVRVRWPRMGTALHLFAEGKSVSGEDEVSVEIPATTAREVVMFFGRVTQPSQPARDYVAFTFETTFR